MCIRFLFFLEIMVVVALTVPNLHLMQNFSFLDGNMLLEMPPVFFEVTTLSDHEIDANRFLPASTDRLAHLGLGR
jgi:N-dimethylarginine dimethylaminohydrolase